MSKGIVLLAAGGTGGHVFPAEALAHTLKARGYSVHLVTDSRAERYAGKFPADEIHVVPSATLGSKNPVSVARSLWKLWVGLRSARKLVAKLKPVAVVGFGGYPTVPPLLASTGLGVPSIIHEQNAVMGRANKALAGRVKAIAGGFLPTASGQYAEKTIATGNPVRPAVLHASEIPYTPSQQGEPFNLVVFGGSQGAQFFSGAVPAAICLMSDAQRSRLTVTQQARPEDKDSVIASYKKLGVKADVSPFFGDMAARIGDADLVISRSGASTVSELSVIGRPSILVPYPHALDHDQAANAAALSAAGGARVIKQAELSPQKLSGLLVSALAEPERLAETAAAARATGKPNAADALADLVEAVANGQSVQEFKSKVEGVGA
ncbi:MULTISPECIES: undecaprenyldiphospho-muramoylpentapeptide beta-N-acetylglucosaminyltransferase [Rhizobium/Agrobacterium group]|uniref:undecaprenyldiphospho-muramoylpentapeptide beta-N-acetylglucosaminyltransferase n=1 Tax=Rhizobium/Agrobacterium group TaxID=227290 RepID=UPI00110E9FFD|nr:MULTISPECIES: undecaprenyldiphospho-muramoylpentapeptide beta-N-acetylglucosaminyltransferase [Rhizobium/Agrobacterium group]NWJ26670.1 undecaprenyldiphospho-muramoylpentapeptide beta-N-acetylglucosaminyltransferase [Rhizobium sp. RM]TMV22552.1 undecaprenyldiphospho-muramoylpentapeptide beta-N-acetylglucosaminyltransferase [Rhizobium sp. Td3]UXS02025.1 undecaprenyldiphospho-muramoylpentapeptide beta-N-acetylglucosaminyltransferase [Agrobacterium tumefaciens]